MSSINWLLFIRLRKNFKFETSDLDNEIYEFKIQFKVPYFNNPRIICLKQHRLRDFFKKTHKVEVDVRQAFSWVIYVDFIRNYMIWCIENCKSSCWCEYKYDPLDRSHSLIFCFKDEKDATLFKLFC
jgi:hypothetical protein